MKKKKILFSEKEMDYLNLNTNYQINNAIVYWIEEMYLENEYIPLEEFDSTRHNYKGGVRQG